VIEDWLPYAGFGALLLLLFAAELAWPLHPAPKGGSVRVIANFALGLLDALILAALPVSTLLAASWARDHGFGALNLVAWPRPLEAAIALAAWSLAIYLIHVAAHRLPWLWRLHRIHHADTAVDLSTGLRHHPLEVLVNALLLAGLAMLLGLDPAAIAVYAVAAAGFALWTHANLRLPGWLERGLRLALVTPAMHHVHHSARREETDSNYGDVILLWDRLFGTCRTLPLAEVRQARIGLGDADDAGAGRLLVQLAAPFRGRSTT
jgi:sterol desaturase/sphingolipid hydroxylase (fatty acid hydroxylase superfamily)